MKQLYILCGVPGSGKSTWAQKTFDESVSGDTAIISRDKIRFALLEDGASYFDHENAVYSKWINLIIDALKDNIHNIVVVDATNLTIRTRKKLLNNLAAKIDLNKIEIIAVDFKVPREICQMRNAEREGWAYVPPNTINSMYSKYQPPCMDKENYNKIITIDKEGSEI